MNYRSPAALLPLALSWSLGACAADWGDVGHAHQTITGGTPESGYPSVFSLAYGGQGGCSGTCIAPQVGLTAAHCVEGESPDVLTALFGASETNPDTILQVTEIAIEPSYGSAVREGDIALVRFAEACPATTPFNPFPLESHVGEPVVMVGFGVTTEAANDAGIKRSGVATLSSVTPGQVSGMQEGELATSNDPDGTCNGDSGGPTFMRIDGVEYVVGVTSRGSTGANGQDEPCGQGQSIATRADSYAALINGFMGVSDPGGDDSGSDPGDDSGNPDPGQDDDPSMDPGSPGTVSAGCQAAGSGAAQSWVTILLALCAWAMRGKRRRPSTRF